MRRLFFGLFPIFLGAERVVEGAGVLQGLDLREPGEIMVAVPAFELEGGGFGVDEEAVEVDVLAARFDVLEHEGHPGDPLGGIVQFEFGAAAGFEIHRGEFFEGFIDLHAAGEGEVLATVEAGEQKSAPAPGAIHLHGGGGEGVAAAAVGDEELAGAFEVDHGCAFTSSLLNSSKVTAWRSLPTSHHTITIAVNDFGATGTYS